ncbi:signal peptide peptidase SppA [Rhodocyclaceae bacterium SMB388]
MIKGVFRFIGRLFYYVGYWLDTVRRAVFNLLFLLLIGVVIAFFWRPTPELADDSVLVLRPVGSLVEQARLEDPLELLRPAGTRVSQTSLRNLLEAVHAARDDHRIRGLVVETDGLSAASLSKLAELRGAIEAFKQSGKPVLARGERFDQGQYYLASVADEVHLSADGFVLLRGFARYVSYFRNALDSLGVKVHVFRVGEYKSFSEPFTRSDMSDEDRANTRDLLDGLWSVFREDIAASRGLEPAALDHYIMDYGDALTASGGDAAQAALKAGLVDRFSTRDQWRELLRQRFGIAGEREEYGEDSDGEDGGDGIRRVSVSRYLAHVRAAAPQHEDQVAVLVAQGSIMDGSSRPGSVGGDSLARLIREAREDDTVKAVVIRIDSPGGSAWASELIRRELEVTRAAGKPVVASMSSTAASGGYWIAAGADEIWAHPVSITGSIGIFAMFPEFSEPLERIGVTVDGVTTAPLAGAFDPRRPMEPLAAEAMQIAIEHGYRRFLDIVARARNMSVSDVDLVARGQVWTGEAASKLGLVDQLGGLDAAIAAAAARAGLRNYDVVWPESRLSPRELLMRQFGDLVLAWGLLAPAAEPPGAPSALGLLLGALEREVEALLHWNDPQHLYTHCLCEAP